MSEDIKPMNWSSLTNSSREKGKASFPVFASTTIGLPIKKMEVINSVEKMSEASTTLTNLRRNLFDQFMLMLMLMLTCCIPMWA